MKETTMRRKLALLALAGVASGVILTPSAEANGLRRGGHGGKYVTYNGSTFGTYQPVYTAPAAPVRYYYYSPRPIAPVPSYGPPAAYPVRGVMGPTPLGAGGS